MNTKPAELPDVICPKCGYVADCAQGVGRAANEKPYPGALSICFNCGDLAVFTDFLYLREIEPEEMARLPDGIRATIATAQIMIRARGPVQPSGSVNSVSPASVPSVSRPEKRS